MKKYTTVGVKRHITITQELGEYELIVYYPDIPYEADPIQFVTAESLLKHLTEKVFKMDVK